MVEDAVVELCNNEVADSKGSGSLCFLFNESFINSDDIDSGLDLRDPCSFNANAASSTDFRLQCESQSVLASNEVEFVLSFTLRNGLLIGLSDFGEERPLLEWLKDDKRLPSLLIAAAAAAARDAVEEDGGLILRGGLLKDEDVGRFGEARGSESPPELLYRDREDVPEDECGSANFHSLELLSFVLISSLERRLNETLVLLRRDGLMRSPSFCRSRVDSFSLVRLVEAVEFVLASWRRVEGLKLRPRPRTES